jgi:hypothetical protein
MIVRPQKKIIDCSTPPMRHRAGLPEAMCEPPQPGDTTMAFSRQIVNKFPGMTMSHQYCG